MKKPRIFYGYYVLATCFLFAAIGAGCSYTSFSLFVKPLETGMGWSRTEIMAAFTILVVFMGITGPFTGRLVDRYGARKIIPPGALLVFTGFILLSQINSLAHYYTAYAVIGIGCTAIGPVALSFVVSHWFVRRRGQAIGIMSMGMGLAGLVFAPFVAVYLIPRFGWSNAYLALAVLVGGIIIPLSLLIIRTRPADMGLFPDGREPSGTDNVAEASARPAEGLSLKMAMATPAFWLIASSVILNHTHLGIWQSTVPYLEDIGFSVGIAASALSATSVTTTGSMFFFGWLCDKIPAKFAAAIGLALIALGALILTNIGPESPLWMIWVFAVVFGLGIGSWMPTLSMLTSTSFGIASYGAIFGMMTLFQNLGGASGPLLAGYLYDTMNTYHWAFLIIMAVVVLAIPLILAARRPTSLRQVKN